MKLITRVLILVSLASNAATPTNDVLVRSLVKTHAQYGAMANLHVRVVRQAGRYMYAMVTSEDDRFEPERAYFKMEKKLWQVLDVGTGATCPDSGIPAYICERLAS